MTENAKKITGEFFEALRSFVTNHTNPIFTRLADLEKRIMELPAPKDGKDGKDVDPLVLETLSKRIDSLTPLAENVATINQGLQELTSKLHDFKATMPKDGADGRDGPPGRDAVHLEILEEIETDRRYQRGTFAKYKGGLIRSFRVTDPINESDLEKSGWTVAVEGIAEIALVQDEDIRTFIVGVRTTSGKTFDSIFTMPVVLDQGIFKPNTPYKKGDAVSRDGSLWIAQKDVENSSDQPAPPDWRLSVKKGKDLTMPVEVKKNSIVRLK